jgi:hypothetical protein
MNDVGIYFEVWTEFLNYCYIKSANQNGGSQETEIKELSLGLHSAICFRIIFRITFVHFLVGIEENYQKKGDKKETDNLGVRVIYVTYFECVFIALFIQCTMRPSQISICGQPGYTVFFHIIS